MSRMNRVDGEIGISHWGFDFDFESEETGTLQELVTKLLVKPIEETLQSVFEEDPPSIWLTAEPDPLTLRVILPLGEDDSSGPEYLVGLRQIIAAELGMVRALDESIAEDEAEGVRAIAAALRQLADKIDQDLDGTDRDFYLSVTPSYMRPERPEPPSTEIA